MRIRALTRHLPTTARFGAIGAILATRLAVGPLVGDTTGPTSVSPDALNAGAAVVAAQHPAPTQAQLSPLPVTAAQSSIPLDAEQTHNAAQIVAAAKKMHLPPRAAVIAVA
ncbi:MAG: hypothetical protein J2P15_06165, partial [Micromonosporaceae bacterium]|nr:hypothetical protein [Micromonosporaceae bacterium]